MEYNLSAALEGMELSLKLKVNSRRLTLWHSVQIWMPCRLMNLMSAITNRSTQA